MDDTNFIIHAAQVEDVFMSKLAEVRAADYPNGFIDTIRTLQDCELLLYKYQDVIQEIVDRGYTCHDEFTPEMKSAVKVRGTHAKT